MPAHVRTKTSISSEGVGLGGSVRVRLLQFPRYVQTWWEIDALLRQKSHVNQ